MNSPEFRPLRKLNISFVPEHATLEELSSTTPLAEGKPAPIDVVEARYHDLLRAGDEVIAFVDYTTDVPGSEHLTVAQHVDHAPTEQGKATKIEQFLRGKNVEQLIEDGYYIGPCVVALSGSAHEIHSDSVRKVRLAIFRPYITALSN